jgi:hypothetical protein
MPTDLGLVSPAPARGEESELADVDTTMPPAAMPYPEADAAADGVLTGDGRGGRPDKEFDDAEAMDVLDALKAATDEDNPSG